MSLDGYNLVGGGSLFSVVANFIRHLDDVNNRAMTATETWPLALKDGNTQSSYAMVAGKLLMIQVGLETNTMTDTVVIQWVKNGSLVGTGITFSAAETGLKQIVEEIDFALGDELQIRVTVNGTGSIDFNRFTIIAHFNEVTI